MADDHYAAIASPSDDARGPNGDAQRNVEDTMRRVFSDDGQPTAESNYYAAFGDR